MKTLIEICCCLALLSSLHAAEKTVETIVEQTIKSIAKEGWEYSARGGYVFQSSIDLVGDEEPEKLTWLSVDSCKKIYIFDSSKDQKYIGEIEQRLLGSPWAKVDGKSLLLITSESGNYFNNGEAPFTKKVISTTISKEGVERLERIAGTGPGDIDDKQFNSILDGSIEKDGFVYFKPQIQFSSLQSYLSSEDKWADFKQEEWVGIDSFLVHRDDAEDVRKIQSLSDEDEIRELLGGFTKEKALQLLMSVDGVSSKPSSNALKVGERNDTKPRVTSDTRSQESNLGGEGSTSSNGGNYFMWLIAVMLVLGTSLLLVKVLIGRSKR